MSAISLEEVRALTYKKRDAWWTVILVDPLAGRLVRLVAGYRWVTPNRLTVAGFVLGLASAGCFAVADRWWLVAGALLYHLSFVIDCMDGKIARLKGNGSIFGSWLDFILDQVRFVVCAVALMGGQYLATGRPLFLLLAVAVLVADMLRYVNGLTISKVKREMREKLRTAEGGAAPTPEEVDDEEHAALDLDREFRSRFTRFIRIRDFLLRHRIRPHLWSGIEFQMAVLIVAPLTGAVVVVSTSAVGLFLLFELAISYKFWLSTRDFEDQLTRLAGPVPALVPSQAKAPEPEASPARTR